MRVAHVIAAMDYGGAERVLVDLAIGQARDGLEVAILAPPGSLDQDWAAQGIDRLRTPAAARNPLDLARAARGIRDGIRAWAPDLIHVHNVKATALTMSATRMPRSRTPVLTTLHGVAGRQMRAAAAILRGSDLVAAVSEQVRRAVVSSGLHPECVEVVHNGVSEIPPLDDCSRAAYDRELGIRGAVVAAVGRLAPEKAHHRFLSAAPAVLEQNPQTTFMVVGDGPLEEDLMRQAARLGIEHAVRFTGARTDSRQLIDRADVFVLSSDREGHSVAALEALAAGTPVVSTAVAGMSELLGTGAGVIVSSLTAEDLAAGITALLFDEGLRVRMGEEGRRLVAERFSTRVMEERYAELYARLLR